jgi:hypothetical protein
MFLAATTASRSKVHLGVDFVISVIKTHNSYARHLTPFAAYAADLNDLHVLDPETLAWSTPEVSGVAPSPRDGLGFASTSGRLYVFGGGYYDRIEFWGTSFSHGRMAADR